MIAKLLARGFSERSEGDFIEIKAFLTDQMKNDDFVSAQKPKFDHQFYLKNCLLLHCFHDEKQRADYKTCADPKGYKTHFVQYNARQQ